MPLKECCERKASHVTTEVKLIFANLRLLVPFSAGSSSSEHEKEETLI